jgi:hypothetical protein
VGGSVSRVSKMSLARGRNVQQSERLALGGVGGD